MTLMYNVLQHVLFVGTCGEGEMAGVGCRLRCRRRTDDAVTGVILRCGSRMPRPTGSAQALATEPVDQVVDRFIQGYDRLASASALDHRSPGEVPVARIGDALPDQFVADCWDSPFV